MNNEYFRDLIEKFLGSDFYVIKRQLRRNEGHMFKNGIVIECQNKNTNMSFTVKPCIRETETETKNGSKLITYTPEFIQVDFKIVNIKAINWAEQLNDELTRASIMVS